ncbi:MAG TPA: glycoside hydrolase family 3 N-terminal domain-containing protein [Lachnospiraceae bacterium]|nr:glycoside hydrolase family 3 N-terminal domain-containing protein [Lachnospiraceae bacterium]
MEAKNISEKVEYLLSIMTLAEKIGQLNQTGTTMVSALPGIEADIDGWVSDMMEGRISQEEFSKRMELCREDLKTEQIENGGIGSFVNLYDDEKIFQVQQAAMKSRLKIPLFIGVDVIRGYRTIFPTPLAMSCSWDMDNYRRMIKIAKKEAKVCGVNWVFGPMLDIARDARWGRIVESPGEDPYLASRIAKTVVNAFQENDAYGRLLCTAKHFLAYGAVSGGQDYNTVDVSERTLYETYLPPFRAAVDAGVGSVMSAFHDLNGVPCTCSHSLLTDLLRGELHFQGFVVSDAEAVKQCVAHGVASDERDAAKMSLQAGNDIDMSSLDYSRFLPDLVDKGEVSVSSINEAVRRVLYAKFFFGIMDEPYRYDPGKISDTVLCRKHRIAAREVAEKSAVLLKNDGVLPIRDSVKHILVTGGLAEDRAALLGPWAFTGDKESVVTVTDGIRNNAPSGVTVEFCRGFDTSDSESGFEEMIKKAEKSDLVIAVVGESAFMSGEAASKVNLNLPGAQEKAMLQLAALSVPCIAVLVSGRPLTIGKLQNNPGIGAILETWHMGCESGNAMADLLFGKCNPSGKLTVTFANEAAQEPMYYNHPNTGKPGGKFKFTSKYQDAPVEPLYPFGYGLSYTAFAYSGMRVSKKKLELGDTLNCEICVRNTGLYAGEEIVQMYIRDVTASCARPVRELKRFCKIKLEPGEEKICSFALHASELGFYRQDCTYTVETGMFQIFIGPDSSKGEMLEIELCD